MANYIVQKESLEIVADSIRAKAGTTEKLEFPYGWKAAVDGIKGGSGSVPFCAVSVEGSNGLDTINTPLLEFGVVSVKAEDYSA